MDEVFVDVSQHGRSVYFNTLQLFRTEWKGILRTFKKIYKIIYQRHQLSKIQLLLTIYPNEHVLF